MSKELEGNLGISLMGHTKPQDLKDLPDELSKIRNLDGVTEKSPGIFYYKSAGFLHFHDKDGKRWADIKVDGDWKGLSIDFGATLTQKKAFISHVIKAHKAFKGKK